MIGYVLIQILSPSLHDPNAYFSLRFIGTYWFDQGDRVCTQNIAVGKFPMQTGS